MEPNTLDHVAFWVTERDAIVDVATQQLGMHVIDRQDNFTLVGSDARRGKLTLFDAEGPRDRGALQARRAARQLDSTGPTEFELPEGIEVRLVEAPTDVEYDLDHVALYTADPEATAEAYARFRLRAGSAEGRRAAGRGRRRATSSFTRAIRARPSSRC